MRRCVPKAGAAVAFCDWVGPLEKRGATFDAISPKPADWSPARAASRYREDVGVEDVAALARDLRAKTGANPMTVHDAMLSHGSIAPEDMRRLTGLAPIS